MHLCGSYGDPIMARDCLEIVEYLSSKTCSVSMSTNGGARAVEWWDRLGKAMSVNQVSRVDFHIDGLADTNNYYRRKTSFEKIMENARSFIEAGGNANWEFIPFKHNEHQIEAARTLSKKIGFSRFTIKKSNWMFTADRKRIRFTTRAGKECFLEAPSINLSPSKMKGRLAEAALPASRNRIHCLAEKMQEIYISCECLLYPCCWTARHGRNIYLGRNDNDGFSELFRAHNGKNVFDLRQQSLQECLESPFFIELSELWQTNTPKVCYKKCGKKDQPEKIKMSNL